ncbi:MAG: hypothetical protein IJU29_07765 [Oscillospiraceae bacterium]|nr:hypothetical protein [Oscillospiraceae bacterium]
MEQRNIPWRRLALGLLACLLLAGFTLRAEYALLPERSDYGAVWSMYLEEPENSLDALFFGSSMAYCDVMPGALYAQTGLTSFVMAGPEQTLSLTLPYVKEALRTQRPAVVCLELSGVMFHRYQGYTRINVGYMPRFSVNRLEATLRGAEESERLGLLFPLYNYHDRWQETSPLALFRPRRDQRTDPNAGATPMTVRNPQEARGVRQDLPTEEEFAENLACLLEIRDWCAQQGVPLALFQVPSCAPIPEDWMERIRAALGNGAIIADFDRNFDAMGLDPAADFYDFLHLNVWGAAKFNRALGDWLQALPELAGRESREPDPLWTQRAEHFASLLTEE